MSIYLNTILSKKFIIYAYYSNDSKGQSGYNIDSNTAIHLWTKEKYKLGLDYSILETFSIDMSYNMIVSSQLYNNESNGFEINFRYNIDY